MTYTKVGLYNQRKYSNIQNNLYNMYCVENVHVKASESNHRYRSQKRQEYSGEKK